MNYLLKTSLIASLLLVALQSTVNADDSNKDAVEATIIKAKYILPPPSPFFSSKITSYKNLESKDTKLSTTENTEEEKSVEALEVALKLQQDQASILLEELHATAKNSDFENEMYEKTVSLLQEKIDKLNFENGKLTSEINATKINTEEQQTLLASLKQESTDISELQSAYKNKISAFEEQIVKLKSENEKKLNALKVPEIELQTLRDAYTIKSDEAEELKKRLLEKETAITPLQAKTESQKTQISSLSEQLSSFEQTQAELIDLQDSVAELNNTNVLLKARIVELDDSNKSLKSQNDKMQQDASQQTRKLGLLSQSTADLEALKSAYKERNEESVNLKEELLEIDNTNKSLISEVQTLKAEASQNARKLALLDKSTAELTALKSAYKERNDEAATLKEFLATTEESNNSLLAQIDKMKADASQNTQKLGLLDQSTTELTELKRAYKEQGAQTALLKSKLLEIEEANKSLNTEIETLKVDASQKSEKLQLLDRSTTELTALEDSYKSLLSEMETMKANASQNSRKLSLFDKSSAELTAIKSAYKERNDEAITLKNKLLETENTNKSLLSRIKKMETDASINTRKLGLLDKSSSQLTALQSAYKERNNEAVSLKEKTINLDNTNKTLLAKIEELENSANQKLGLLDQSTAELDSLKNTISESDKNNQALSDQLTQLQTNNKLLQEKTAAAEQLQTELEMSKSKLNAMREKLAESENLKQSLKDKISALEADSSKQKMQLTDLSSVSKELETLNNAFNNLKTENLKITNKFTAAMLDPDNDGVVNELDQCKSSPLGSSVNNIGCPDIADADGDKVPDSNDLCSNTSANAKVNKFGCASDKTITLEGVNFATGSDRLTKNSLSIINTVANALKTNPSIKVEVAGHTDGLGVRSVNQKLSKRRANAVAIQLIEQGVDASRISAKGYGESSPIAPNTDEAGRLKNRRVELKIR